MKKLSKKDLIARLKDLHNSSDAEIAHSDADDLLIAFINDSEVTEAYDKVPKWYA